MHETSYEYTDRNKHTKTAKVRVLCPFGLSASDELTLWGLLALTPAATILSRRPYRPSAFTFGRPPPPLPTGVNT